MRIGVDFDNTIVCWDEAFHAAALDQGEITPDVPKSKEKVRDHMRANGHEEEWIVLQGYVYGALADRAPIFPGVTEFFRACHDAGIEVAIISHKTRHPFRGPQYDLHQAARECLDRNGFHDPGGIGLSAENVYFELTKAEKLDRIGALGCDCFIDDLPEFLAEPAFPPSVDRILFDPYAYHAESDRYRRATSWPQIQQWLASRT
jgi:hypothetical protein